MEIKTSFSKEVTLGLRLAEPTEKEPDKLFEKSSVSTQRKLYQRMNAF